MKGRRDGEGREEEGPDDDDDSQGSRYSAKGATSETSAGTRAANIKIRGWLPGRRRCRADYEKSGVKRRS